MKFEIETTIDTELELEMINKVMKLKSQPFDFGLYSSMIYLTGVIDIESGIKFGRGSDHIWISRTSGERILLITRS